MPTGFAEPFHPPKCCQSATILQSLNTAVVWLWGDAERLFSRDRMVISYLVKPLHAKIGGFTLDTDF